MLMDRVLRLFRASGYQFTSHALGQPLPHSEDIAVAYVTETMLKWVVPATHKTALTNILQTLPEIKDKLEVQENAADKSLIYCWMLNSEQSGEEFNVLRFLSSGTVSAFVIEDQAFYFPKPLTFEHVHDNTSDDEYLRQLVLLENSALAQNLAGKISIELGKIDDGAKFFRKACELCPAFAEPYSNIGTLLWQENHRAEGFHMFCEALMRNPYSQLIQDNFIRSGLDLADYEKMAEIINRVTMADPSFHDLLYLKALIAHSLGRSTEAKLALQQLMISEPENQQAKELYSEIVGVA